MVYKRKRTGNDVGDFSFWGGDTMIGPPPKTIILLGKEYFPAEPMKQQLRDLRAEIARLEYDRDYWKRIALGA